MAPNEQTPLHVALEAGSKRESDGVYKTGLPKSVCFGDVCHGGIILAFVHTAAADHMSRSPRSAQHLHARTLSANFLRPTFPEPEICQVRIKEASVNRGWTTAHVEVTQKEKLCVVGYITMTDLAKPGTMSLNTDWTLSPGAPLLSSPIGGSDVTDSDWVEYRTPFVPGSFRQAMSYVRYRVPLSLAHANVRDQWITPGWRRSESTDIQETKWTNDMVHFIMDSSLTILDNLFPPGQAYGQHTTVVALAQGKQTDTGAYTTPAVTATLALQTEVKKLLPEEGVKWLYLRAHAKQLQNNRMDTELILLDESGDIVAITSQVIQVTPTHSTKTRRVAAL